MTDDKKEFLENELRNNKIIAAGVEAWKTQINARSIGVVDEDHPAHTLLNKPTDKEFFKAIGKGRIIVEDCLNRWISGTSKSVLVAKSTCKSQIKEMDGRRFLLLQIEIEEENKPFSVKKKEDAATL